LILSVIIFVNTGSLGSCAKSSQQQKRQGKEITGKRSDSLNKASFVVVQLFTSGINTHPVRINTTLAYYAYNFIK
jgi:hypothetical protein